MNDFEAYKSYFSWFLESSNTDAMGKTEIYNTSYNNKGKKIPIKAFIRYYNDTSTNNSDASFSAFLECCENDITDTMQKTIAHDLVFIIYQNRAIEFIHKNGQIPPEVHFILHFVDKIPKFNGTWCSIYCNQFIHFPFISK